jgi:hypothetical protein
LASLRGPFPYLFDPGNFRMVMVIMQVLEHPAGGPRGGHEFQKPSGPGGFLLQGDQGSAFARGDSVDAVSDSAGSMEFPVVSGLSEQGDLASDPGRSDSRGFQLGQIPRAQGPIGWGFFSAGRVHVNTS